MTQALTAASEVRLIASDEIGDLADQVALSASSFNNETARVKFGSLKRQLIHMMRADLGES